MSSAEDLVPSIERALDVLEFLSQTTKGFTLSEVSRRLSLPKSSTYMILRTLSARGYLKRNLETGFYHFGLKLVSLSRTAVESLEIVDEARPFLRALMNRTGLTTQMAVMDNFEAVLVEKIDPPWPNRLNTSWIGRRVPTHCTGIGKALVSFLPEQELEKYLLHRTFCKHNQYTISSVDGLRREFAQIRERGYSVSDEEFQISFRGIAAPIFDRSRRVVAAISVDGTTQMVPFERIEPNGRIVNRTAAALSAHLGTLEG